jgi:hypothetical protein
LGKGALHGASTFEAGKVTGVGQNRTVYAALPEGATQRKLISVTFTLDCPQSPFSMGPTTLRVTKIGTKSCEVSFIDNVFMYMY